MNLNDDLKILDLTANYTTEELENNYKRKLEELNHAYNELKSRIDKKSKSYQRKELIIDQIIIKVIFSENLSEFTSAKILSVLDEIKKKALNNQISLANIEQLEKLKLNESTQDIIILYYTLKDQDLENPNININEDKEFSSFLKSFFDDELIR